MSYHMAETWPNNGDSSELSELEIVSAALSGDAGAMEQLLAKSEAPLRTALAGQIAQPFQAVLDVDDVIQVTFIEAFLRIGQFTDRGPGSFLAWLTTLARNNLRDAIKALRAEKRIPRHRMVSVGAESDSYEGLLAQLGSTTTTPSGVAAVMAAVPGTRSSRRSWPARPSGPPVAPRA